jgi:uncharacterized protein
MSDYFDTPRRICTFTGRMVNPLALRPDDVCIEDIAHALALKNRFTGHTQVPYSVAQHCVIGAQRISPEYSLHFLLHDAAEAYLPDVAAPLKPKVRMGSLTFECVEALILRVIYTALDVPTPLLDEEQHVGHMDLQMVITERRDVLHPELKSADWGPKYEKILPLPDPIAPCSWVKAESDFLEMWERLSHVV